MSRSLWLALILLALFSLGLGLCVGSVAISPAKIFTALSGGVSDIDGDIIFGLRLPRVLSGFICGALLALSGMLLQVLLRNPLADPYILGVSGGASLAGLLALMLGASALVVQSAALLGAGTVISLVFGLSYRTHGWRMENLLLVGVIISAGFSALITLLLTLAPASDVRGMLFWLMGDLSHADTPWFAAIVLVICAAIVLVKSSSLDVLSLGVGKARSLGVDVSALQMLIYFCAAAACAVVVMTAGAIGFVGLIAPHAARMLGATQHRALTIASMLIGGSLVCLADTLARSVIAPLQLPVGVLMALFGVPAMLFLLTRPR
jgi:iron complex transport system permease protein